MGGTDISPSEEKAMREMRLDRIRKAVLVIALLFLPAVLFPIVSYYMYRYTIPAKTVVESADVKEFSHLGEYIDGSAWGKKYLPPPVREWLKYRYRDYVVSDGTAELDWGAFARRSELRGVHIPESVTVIRGQAFFSCDKLRRIELPSGITEIAEMTFQGCSALEKIRIPDGVKTIGNKAFYGCTALREIVIPQSVKVIGDDAFRGCTALTSVRIQSPLTAPDNVTIGRNAFQDCTALRSVELPDTVNSMGEAAFCNCTALEEIRLPVVERVYDLGGVGYEAYAGGVPERVCMNCTSLKKAVLPARCFSIGDTAFSGCAGLSDIAIPDNVTHIGACAFFGCTGLPPLVLGKNLGSVWNGAFSGTGCRITV